MIISRQSSIVFEAISQITYPSILYLRAEAMLYTNRSEHETFIPSSDYCDVYAYELFVVRFCSRS